jgi:prepilin-type N-terminal cleavage/methylation domain-containing protein
MARRASRRAFTLLEVIVALSIGALVVMGARVLLEGLQTHTVRLVSVANTTNAAANAEHVVRTLVGNLELAPNDSSSFEGDAREARFTSWCAVPEGWQERCTVHLAVESETGRVRMMATLSTGERLTLRDSAGAAVFRYLGTGAEGGRWFVTWKHSLMPPLAIGLISDADTMVARVGERR